MYTDDTSEEPCTNIFRRAIKSFLDDDSFKLNSPVAVEARNVAEALLKWSAAECNEEKLSDFTRKLFNEFKKPFISSAKLSCSREQLWKSYFLLRSSQQFVNMWIIFLKSVDLTPTPIFYRHLTDIIFRQLIHNHFVCSSSVDSSKTTAVTHQEGSALRYAAGYICRHLRKKIERGSYELKDELVLCLMALVKDRSSEECGDDEEWTKMMDRGGLWHIKETTYALFLAIEEEIRDCLKSLTTPTPKSKKDHPASH